MQAITLKRYPAQLSLTTWMGFIGAAQSAVFTLCIEHRRAAWAIGFNIDLWSILYSGAVCSDLKIFVQLWCTEKKGPVFVAMFDPVSTVFVALLAYFVLGERLYTGS
ncbi:nodulin MtN21 /EamA-like transporter family protein [Prunus dulcis]|uniref:WAT1-related protein n=1 Tax=Prunus dulcis TaxID=3755 RepID=A0A4Y1QL40_PRUDU|nr:nodulin MtN21 /EamA-like transporter family protein [Prunus dulcis]